MKEAIIILNIACWKFYFSFLYVAKFDLGKVRLKPMQSVVSPFTVRDLQVGHLGGL